MAAKKLEFLELVDRMGGQLAGRKLRRFRWHRGSSGDTALSGMRVILGKLATKDLQVEAFLLRCAPLRMTAG